MAKFSVRKGKFARLKEFKSTSWEKNTIDVRKTCLGQRLFIEERQGEFAVNNLFVKGFDKSWTETNLSDFFTS